MVVLWATQLFNRYAADPEARDYKLLSAIFLLSGENPQMVMSHAEEWLTGPGRLEFMTLVEYCPTMAQDFYDGCCLAFNEKRPVMVTWRHDGNEWWEPSMGRESLDQRCSAVVDDSGHKVRISMTTPVFDVRAMAAFAE